MPFRTIVINGDETWRFVDLLWTHALDLYPPASNVSFVSTVDPTRASGTPNYRRILGNYPESFGDDPSSLENEISDEVSDLDSGRTGRLAVLAVISAEDFDTIAGKPGCDAGDIAERLGTLSASGAAAVRALRAASRRIANLSGNRGEISPLAHRLWLALAVRARGFEAEHKQQADAAMAALAGGPSGIGTTFFLSNGRSLDEGALHPHYHFVKLRLLIDVLRAGADANMPLQELKGLKSGGTGGVFWVRFEDRAAAYLDHSAVLQARLVETYEELRAGRMPSMGGERLVDVEAAFDHIADQLEKVAGNPMTLENGQGELKTAIAALAREPETDGATTAGARHTPDSMALDYQKVQRGGLLRSRGRTRAIRDDAAAFEAEMARIGETVRTHTINFVAEEERWARTRRLEVQKELAGLRVPESEAPVAAFRERLALREAKFRTVIGLAAELNAQLTSGKAELDADIAQRRAERDALRQRLLAAEDNLLGRGILFRVPVTMTIIVLVPFILMLLGRTQYGTMPDLDLATLLKNLFPVPYILSIVLGVGLVVGLARAWVMARRRDRARRAYGTAMLEEFKRRIDQHAAPLVRAVNRKRLSVLNLVSSRMNVVDPVMISNASDALINSLGATRKFLNVSSQALPESVRELAGPALEGFSQGVLRPDKVTGFLKSIGTLPESTFQLRMHGAERKQITIPSRTSLAPPNIVFSEPGSTAAHGHA